MLFLNFLQTSNTNAIYQILYFCSYMPQGRSVSQLQKKDSQKSITVFLRLHNGNGCELLVQKLITLQKFKEAVSKTDLQLPTNCQLVFHGKNLEKNNATLASLGVVNGSIIHIDNCQPSCPPKLKLDVGFIYQGEKMVIRASIQQTILSLKTKIYRLIGVLPKNQLIIFRGSRLDDQQTLAFYHIAEDSLLCLHTNHHTEDIPIPEASFNEKRELISSTVSANFSTNKMRNKLNMFRSQSMGMQKQSFEVEIRENTKEELLDSKDFKFQLMTPITTAVTSLLTQNQSAQFQQNSSKPDYKILINAEEFSRNHLMII